MFWQVTISSVRSHKCLSCACVTRVRACPARVHLCACLQHAKLARPPALEVQYRVQYIGGADTEVKQHEIWVPNSKVGCHGDCDYMLAVDKNSNAGTTCTPYKPTRASLPVTLALLPACPGHKHPYLELGCWTTLPLPPDARPTLQPPYVS